MKNRLSVLVIVCLWLILTACRHAAPAENQLLASSLSAASSTATSHPQSIIELSNGHDSVCGQWRVVMSPENGLLHISRLSVTGSVTISPQNWRATNGAFVFVEGDERVWAYEGDADLFLLAKTTDGFYWYAPHEGDGRWKEDQTHCPCVIGFWADHAIKELRIIDIEEV